MFLITLVNENESGMLLDANFSYISFNSCIVYKQYIYRKCGIPMVFERRKFLMSTAVTMKTFSVLTLICEDFFLHFSMIHKYYSRAGDGFQIIYLGFKIEMFIW